jgi:hypothetical protein
MVHGSSEPSLSDVVKDRRQRVGELGDEAFLDFGVEDGGGVRPFADGGFF